MSTRKAFRHTQVSRSAAATEQKRLDARLQAEVQRVGHNTECDIGLEAAKKGRGQKTR